MANQRYNTPDAGTLDWHLPLNENFKQLDRDVEIRDLEANKANYEPAAGAKFLATDTAAVYTGDGSAWNLVGYVTRAGGGDFGHYVNYQDGLQDEEINKFLLESDEQLEVIRISLPMKDIQEGTTDSNVSFQVYEGGTGGTKVVEVAGNECKTAASDSSGPWVASVSPVTVTVTNATGGPIDVVPKIFVNIRRS